MSFLFAVAQRNRLEMLIFVVEPANCESLVPGGAEEVKHMSFKHTKLVLLLLLLLLYMCACPCVNSSGHFSVHTHTHVLIGYMPSIKLGSSHHLYALGRVERKERDDSNM